MSSPKAQKEQECAGNDQVKVGHGVWWRAGSILFSLPLICAETKPTNAKSSLIVEAAASIRASVNAKASAKIRAALIPGTSTEDARAQATKIPASKRMVAHKRRRAEEGDSDCPEFLQDITR